MDNLFSNDLLDLSVMINSIYNLLLGAWPFPGHNSYEHHPIVMAECTQGNLHCSKTGGISLDNSEQIIENDKEFNAMINIAGAITGGTTMVLFLVADGGWLILLFGLFFGLAISGLITSAQGIGATS